MEQLVHIIGQLLQLQLEKIPLSSLACSFSISRLARPLDNARNVWSLIAQLASMTMAAADSVLRSGLARRIEREAAPVWGHANLCVRRKC
jgi:hypothetical protein